MLQVGSMDELCIHFSTVHNQSEKRTCLLRSLIIVHRWPNSIVTISSFEKYLVVTILSKLSPLSLFTVISIASMWKISCFLLLRKLRHLDAFSPSPSYSPFVLHNLAHNFFEIGQHTKNTRSWKFIYHEVSVTSYLFFFNSVSLFYYNSLSGIMSFQILSGISRSFRSVCDQKRIG